LLEARPWVGPDSALELYEQTLGVLRHRHGDLETAFRERLAAALHPAGQPAEPNAAVQSRGVAQAGLMDDDMHYDFAAPDTLAQAIALACKGELYSLDRRCESLLGRRVWHDLPFGPQHVARAVVEAMRGSGLARPIRQSLLPLLTEYLPSQIRPVYQTLNQFLAERQVLPELKLGLPAKNPVGTVASVCQDWLMRQSLAQPAPLPIDTPATELDLKQALIRLRQGDAGAAARLGLGPTGLEPAHSLLRRIGQAAQLSLSATDKVVLDWLAIWFETKVFVPALAADWQARLGRLQLPALQAALQAPEQVLRQTTHPVRLLLERLSVLACSEAGQTVLVKAQVAGLIEALQAADADPVAAFAAALADLPVPTPTSGQAADKSALAAPSQVQAALAGHRIPGAMVAFLTEHWAGVVRQAEPAEAEAVLRDLIASLEPTTWSQRRADLTASLPNLLKRLKHLIEQAGIAGEVRDKFFTDLVKCHALLMQATAAGHKTKSDSKAA